MKRVVAGVFVLVAVGLVVVALLDDDGPFQRPAAAPDPFPAPVPNPWSEPPAETARPAIRVPTQPDESLTPEEYVELGMPAHDRLWLKLDMVKAADVLTALVKTKPRALPRYQNPRSGPVFARITSPETYQVFRAGTLPAAWQMDILGEYYDAATRVLKLYMTARLGGGVGGDEEVEVYGISLRGGVAIFGVSEEFVLTLPKDDQTDQVRRTGMNQMKSGAALHVTAALDAAVDRVMLGRAERVRLLGYMRETFPHLVPRLQPGSRAEVVRRLGELNADPANAELQPGLRHLAAEIAAALRDPPAPVPRPTPPNLKK